MLTAFERLVAVRYLRARRREGFVSVIAGFSLVGIALGVATLIIVMAVMNGFRQELISRILGLNGHLGVFGPGGGWVQNYDDMADRLRELDNVVSVMPVLEGHVMASTSMNAQGAVVRGIRPQDVALRPALANGVYSGDLADFGGDKVYIGYRLAQKLGITPGHGTITLTSPAGRTTGFGTMPLRKTFEVAATYDVGMHEYNANFVFMDIEQAQILFNRKGLASHLEVRADHPENVDDLREEVMSAVQSGRIFDWQQSNSAFVNALNVERNVMFLILTLIILVAAFNIISGMIMLVKDKSRNIAIMRTMGATRGAILRIFMATGSAIGVTGTAIGLVVGVVFCENIEAIQQGVERITGADVFNETIYFLTTLPAEMDVGEVVAVTAMAITLSFLATLYPAWRAARLDPVEALRYE